MCGRFTHMMTWSQLHALYSIHSAEPGKNTAARYNIAPTQNVWIMVIQQGERVLKEARWGLLPHWAKDEKGPPHINARVETLATNKLFGQPFQFGRCLIPADGYYEWTEAADGKDPWHIHLEGHEPFSFAGLFSYNRTLDKLSCTIITGPAVPPTIEVHDRMPIILDPAVYEEWTNPETTLGRARDLLDHRHLGAVLRMYRVGRQVNSSRFEGDRQAVLPIFD